jgi:hypothetical protein
LNIPPANGKFLISPSNGTALITDFSISLPDWVDSDKPLTYKFMVYTSQEELYTDLSNGTNYRANLLSDFSQEFMLATKLPAGKTTINGTNITTETLTIVVSISDS